MGDIPEQDLKQTAMRYLKQQYGEDTESMDIIDNNVQNGSGVLHVDCTVSVAGARSSWTKWFTFEDGQVVDLQARMQ